jgi:predicted nucleotidyltransferase
MRLSQKEINFIKSKIKHYFPDATIYLFGSILKDKIKGGDIEIYIITSKKADFMTKSNLKFELESYLFRPVDLVFHKNFDLPIEKEAEKGVLIR